MCIYIYLIYQIWIPIYRLRPTLQEGQWPPLKIGDLTKKNGRKQWGYRVGICRKNCQFIKKKNYEKWLINGFIDDLPIKNGWLMDL